MVGRGMPAEPGFARRSLTTAGNAAAAKEGDHGGTMGSPVRSAATLFAAWGR
jgi:hypothetical protein